MRSDPEELMRPWIQVAAFCTVAMTEGGPGNWVSLIRILDRVFVPGSTDEMPPSTIQTTLVVMLKSGNMRTTATVRIRPLTPSKKELPPIEIPVLFEGDERGINIIIPVVMRVEEAGLYWFDVFVESELFTRIPLRVLYQRAAGIVPPRESQKPEG